jgi:hypothetical protein
MSNSDNYKVQPNNVDYTDSSGYPTNPATVNYDYLTSNYNKPTEPGSNYEKTNYSITNFPQTDYNKFNSGITNYEPVPEINYDNSLGYSSIYADLPLKGSVNNKAPFNIATCQSPDMLYEVPRDPQYKSVQKYMCFNDYNKLLEITKDEGIKPDIGLPIWFAEDLTYSNLHIKWQGSQCKITTPDLCSRDKLAENCEATCFITPNDAVNIKYQDNIWRVPDLEKKAGACTKTAISEDTAQNSYCQCNNVLERPILKTKASLNKNYDGKFWCEPENKCEN